MKVIRPVTVVDAIYTAGTIAEPDAANDNAATLWDSGTTYSTPSVYVYRPNHILYKNINTTGNTNKVPEDEPTFWLASGYTNKYRMFDGTVESQSVRTNSLSATLTPGSFCDSLALINCEGNALTVVTTDPSEVDPVFNYAGSMISTQGITDAWRWHFEPVRRVRDVAFMGLPPYLNASTQFTLTAATGALAKCGVAVIGQSLDLGGTLEPARFGTTNYDVKETILGVTTVQDLGFARRANYETWLNVADIDWVRESLELLRGRLCVYVGIPAQGDRTTGSSINYGYYEDFEIVRTKALKALCNIQIQGVI